MRGTAAGQSAGHRPAAKCLDDVPSILERLELSGDKIAELRSHYQALDSVGSGRFQSIVDLMKAVSRYLASNRLAENLTLSETI